MLKWKYSRAKAIELHERRFETGEIYIEAKRNEKVWNMYIQNVTRSMQVAKERDAYNRSIAEQHAERKSEENQDDEGLPASEIVERQRGNEQRTEYFGEDDEDDSFVPRKLFQFRVQEFKTGGSNISDTSSHTSEAIIKEEYTRQIRKSLGFK